MKESLIYGPVPSRRLGLSLGVDMVPYKTCTFNCIYCQIGPTAATTIERRPYIEADRVMAALEKKIDAGLRADFITLGGSGEPTLNSEIGQIIRRIKYLTDIPVAVLTNGALLYEAAVQAAISAADVVLPSLDAPDEKTFYEINRPHPAMGYQLMVDGLAGFRKIYSGRIWLEIFLIQGINTSEQAMAGFRTLIQAISPDRVHLNTAVRPPAEAHVQPVSEEQMAAFARMLGDQAEVIAEFPQSGKSGKQSENGAAIVDEIFDMVSRRPCTLADITAGLGLHRSEVVKHLDELRRDGRVQTRQTGEQAYYMAANNAGDSLHST
ncbi:MAG: radical SAM protein [Thermodesulfobacteriota bacterium]